MNLTSRQQHALVSICDTFLPAFDEWPSASDLNIPSAIAGALDFNPRSNDRAQLLQLLDLWDSQLHSLFTVGRLARFSSLPADARIRVLLSWASGVNPMISIEAIAHRNASAFGVRMQG